MKFDYYPEEIAAALCDLCGEEYTADMPPFSDYVDCIYTLHAICENEYNSDFYRAFYRLLERVTEAHVCGRA